MVGHDGDFNLDPVAWVDDAVVGAVCCGAAATAAIFIPEALEFGSRQSGAMRRTYRPYNAQADQFSTLYPRYRRQFLITL
jgi:hypothetical protein